MVYRVGIVFSGPNSDHEILSHRLQQEDALAEFRALRKLWEEKRTIARTWAHLSPESVVAIHIVEENGYDS